MYYYNGTYYYQIGRYDNVVNGISNSSDTTTAAGITGYGVMTYNTTMTGNTLTKKYKELVSGTNINIVSGSGTLTINNTFNLVTALNALPVDVL